MRVCVFGLWHLGCVTAACLAEAGHEVVGLDFDEATITGLRQGRAPVAEPGLDALIVAQSSAGRLSFSSDAAVVADCELLWVAFDTPVNEADEADVDFVKQQIHKVIPHLPPRTLILVSSQAPVGFCRSLERYGLRVACSPENLRLGKALECFRQPERIVVGRRTAEDEALLRQLLSPITSNLLWTSVESAEMTKHALNAFLATSVTFINELARVCEAVGADAGEVEQGLKSDRRIGRHAYLSAGGAFAGGTLARDVRFLMALGQQHGLRTPVFEGVWTSNELHKGWVKERLSALLSGAKEPAVCLLGLTYKPGTDTLRRSPSVELARWLWSRGVRVQAYDPAIGRLPEELQSVLTLHTGPDQALRDADAVVVATDWPEFRGLSADHFVSSMRRPRVIDPRRFLASALQSDPRVTYIATGRPLRERFEELVS